MSRIRSLRMTAIVMVVLLALQFELGMAVNLSPSLEDIPPVAGTPAAIWHALVKVGAGAPVHAILGTLLTVVALVSLILSLRTGSTLMAVIGAASFVSVMMAAVNGILFTMSGFKDDHYSHGMATAFILSFSLFFVQIAILTLRVRQSRA